MSERSVEEVNDGIVSKGGLLVNMYFDMHGNSGEVIQHSLVDMIGKITHEPGVVYATGAVDKPIECESLYSSCAEVKLLARDLNSLINVCFRYGPVGIEVLKPEEMKLSLPQLHELLLNVSQTSQEFTKYIYEKLMDPEERVEYHKKLINKAELAKKLVEKGKPATKK